MATPLRSASSLPVVGAYFASWRVLERGYFVKDIPAQHLNTLYYAFAEPRQNGTVGLAHPDTDYRHRFEAHQSVTGRADVPDQPLAGNFNQLMALRAANPHLRLVLGIGGWAESRYYSVAAATPDSRRAFVDSCIDQFIRGNLNDPGLPGKGGGAIRGLFDGIDLDWEYPTTDPGNGAAHSPEDRDNLNLLAADLRAALDLEGAESGRHLVLTAAIPGGSKAGVYCDLPELGRILDWINVMCYDYHGTQDDYAAFCSPFLADPADPASGDPALGTSGTIEYFIRAGVPPEKLCVGVPFYGNQYDVAVGEFGLYQAARKSSTELEPATFHGLVDELKILSGEDYSTAGGGLERHWSDAVAEPFLWGRGLRALGEPGPADRGVFVCYEDPTSIRQRARLVRQRNLGGVFAWEISQDSDDHALTRAMSEG